MNTGSVRPNSIKVEPSGKFAYVTNYGNDSISMYNVNAASGFLSPLTPATIPTGKNPGSIAISTITSH